MTILLKCLLFTTLFTLTQTFNWLGYEEAKSCGRIPASAGCLSAEFADLENVAFALEDDKEKLYDSIKTEFLASPFCEADKVLNDPSQRLNPIVFNQAIVELTFLTKWGTTVESKKIDLKNFVMKYGLSDEFKNYALDLIQECEDSGPARYMVLLRLRGSALQEMDQISKTTPGYRIDDIKAGLISKGIFVPGKEISCPFVNHDVFMNALRGREKLLKNPALASRLSKKNQITIVDYSVPSNQRRMFVIDLTTGKVIHNTWAAHGRGNDGLAENGIDGWGSSPPMSNANGSNLSSDGFIIAQGSSAGPMYGPNVILDGVDLNNSKLKSRAVVLHGWRTPMHGYVSGIWDFNEAQTKRILPAPDAYPGFMKIDYKTATEDEMFIPLDMLRLGSNDNSNKIDGTNGCMGVSEANARHLDRKGRNKSQLELLREDLPGSLIFNYSGPEMKSKFL